jgi:hypothetical protein
MDMELVATALLGGCRAHEVLLKLVADVWLVSRWYFYKSLYLIFFNVLYFNTEKLHAQIYLFTIFALARI